MRPLELAAAVMLVFASTACADSNDDSVAPPWDDGPGSQAWNNDNVACSSDTDCSGGETCIESVCRMQVCGEPSYSSAPPLGKLHYFGLDREVGVVGDSHYVDTYEPKDASYAGSFDLTQYTASIIDIAGGTFNDKRPQQFAVARQNTKSVAIIGQGSPKNLAIDMVPIAVAAGDVDGDGLDELVALGKDGSIAVCDVERSKCNHYKLSGVEGIDVTVADVDGDGYEEPVFLLNAGGKREVYVWNLDAPQTKQDDALAWTFGDEDLRAIAGGDLDGDGIAELVLLHESGWWDQKDDQLHVFSTKSGQITNTTNVNGHTVDVAVGDINSDGKAEVAVLRSQRVYEIRRINAQGALDLLYEHSLDVASSSTRIAMSDVDGDSAAGKLLEGPTLVAGNVVPTTVMMFPPYNKTWSADGDASVTVGEVNNETDSVTHTVGLSAGVSYSYGGDFGVGPVKVSAGYSEHIQKSVDYSKTISKSLSVGKSYSLSAHPELGRDYAGIVLASACYHAYKYRSDDPANKIGGSGQDITVLIPVGGETQLWSTKRYNAMAKAIGGMPIVNVAYVLGDATSYPTTPETLDKKAIAANDIVFPSPPSFQVSDIGTVGWSLSVGQTETNSVSTTTTIGVSASIGAFGAKVEGNTSVSWGDGYSIAVGKTANFSGDIPALYDNKDTPEDEFKLHRYAFTPLVFRQHYDDSTGGDAAFYVVSYTVSPPPQ